VNIVVAISSILLHNSTLSCTKKNTEKLFSIMTGIILMIPLSTASSTAIDSQLSLGLQTSHSPRCIPLTIEEEYAVTKAAINKDRERELRTGEPFYRTRIVDRAARAGARCLPLVRPQFDPPTAFCSLLLSNGISLLGSRVAGHLVLGSVRAVRSPAHSHVLRCALCGSAPEV
jgi:hypothetical protein